MWLFSLMMMMYRLIDLMSNMWLILHSTSYIIPICVSYLVYSPLGIYGNEVVKKNLGFFICFFFFLIWANFLVYSIYFLFLLFIFFCFLLFIFFVYFNFILIYFYSVYYFYSNILYFIFILLCCILFCLFYFN